MNKLFLLIISLPFIFCTIACGQTNTEAQKQQQAVVSSGKVDVYYFHFTQRCVTCISVQKATEKVLNENYKKEIDNGSLVYHEINLSEPESMNIAKLLDIGNQGLFVVNGSIKYDLTMQGFMYAPRDYDRFKQTLEEAISKVRN
jgi:hypothetical protein